MFRLTDEQLLEFADAVRAAAGRHDLAGPLSAIYESVNDAVELHRPRCDASGACCQFERYGHSLLVTTIEMAVFVAGLTQGQPNGDEPCPYQIGGRCSVHAIRPFGCRVFYCDPSATAWQQDLYDRLHRQIRSIHERKSVPYYYVEWRQALDAMRQGHFSGPELANKLVDHRATEVALSQFAVISKGLL